MFNKLKISIFTAIFFSLALFMFAQEADGHDDSKVSADTKFTTINFLIASITDTPQGTIVEYRTEYNLSLSTAYIPLSVFASKKVIKIVSNTAAVRNQMNLILKDGKPDRLKMYVPPANFGSTKFKYKTSLSKDEKDEFAKVKSFEDIELVY